MLGPHSALSTLTSTNQTQFPAGSFATESWPLIWGSKLRDGCRELLWHRVTLKPKNSILRCCCEYYFKLHASIGYRKSTKQDRKWRNADKRKMQAWKISAIEYKLCTSDTHIERNEFKELKARQMLETPEGINRHIKHNITSYTGVQSLLLPGELLHYVSLPQFKSQELETNAPQTRLAHAKSTLGSAGWVGSSVWKAKALFVFGLNSNINSGQRLSYTGGEINIKSVHVSLVPSTQQ